ncbi:MAG: gluconokinase [Bacteroidia bacterium]|nr:gluconokinase [Bacteroidia bacterium]NNM22631.1 gluconokinase [Flavobacteriaceae bacterium]
MNRAIIIMGVSGSGKTTVGKKLSKSLRIPYYDADDFHSEENIEKMANGNALTDTDRWPWLEKLNNVMKEALKEHALILACSALKEAYRQRLTVGISVNWVYLSASYETIYKRMSQRNHFMKPQMLQSQFETMEPPSYGIQLDASKPVDELIEELTEYLKSHE